jgi:hypothetical protein
MPPGDLAPEDRGEFVRLADGAIGIEQPFAESVEGRPPLKDQVVAVLDLREKQPVLTAGLAAFGGAKEGDEGMEPLLGTPVQIARPQGVGQLLQADRVAAAQERVPRLAKGDPLGAQPAGEPVVLIETDACGERKVRTDPNEHPAPVAVAEIEVVLDDPAAGVLQVPPVVLADGGEDPRRFAGLQDDDHLIRRSAPEVALDKLVAAACRRLDNGRPPLLRSGLHPGPVLIGDPAQDGLAHRIRLAVGVEEAQNPFRLLKRLNHSVEEHPIETPVGETRAILVMLVEGVHGRLQVDNRKHKPGAPSTGFPYVSGTPRAACERDIKGSALG